MRKCNKYFLNHQIPDEQKLEVIEMHLDGKANRWFQGVKIKKPNLGWEQFRELLCSRFNDRNCMDVV